MKPEEVQTLIQSSKDLKTTYLGSRKSNLGIEENIGLSDDKRLTHVLNLGPTGYGKTQLLLHIALQDAYKNNGLAIINPKGDLIDEFIAKLPDNRIEDIIYINPAKQPVASINVLEPQVTPDMTEPQKENQKEIIVSDLIDLFKRQSENWGDQFGRVLETLLRAHIDLNIKKDENNTLVDVFRCVTQDNTLTQLIDRVDDTIIREQLVRVKEDMTSYEMEPLQRRLNDFIMNKTIRRVIEAPESGLDFQKAVNQGKIILVDIQKGEVGETVSQLVGSIVITKIWAVTQSRVNQPIEKRTPFFLYVDELQNFAGEGSNFTKILSEAREYRLGCWLATQYLDKLHPEMRRAVTNNCRTKIIFNPSGSENLSRIHSMLQGLDRDTLTSLGKYRAAIQKPSKKQNQTAFTFDTYPPWHTEHREVDTIKKKQAAATSHRETKIKQSLGQTPNAGQDRHKELLQQAKNQLEERGFQVNLLYQDPGSNKPDGIVHLDDEVAHLEAEHSTLSKPVKVLNNLKRAANQNRESIFIVEQGNAPKLQNIINDPKNRRGNEYQDEKGSYTYYTGENGEAFTDFEQLEDAEHRIIEIQEDQLEIHEEAVQPKCPELDNYPEEDLQAFCLHREDGFCEKLEQKCVLQQ